MNNKLNIPTILTWSRIVILPFMIAIYYLPEEMLNIAHKNIIATILFGIACISDYLDGYLARKLKQESRFGAFLDPVADKAIVAATLVVLVYLGRTFMFAAIIIILREIAISALREWMAQIGKTQHIAVAYLGKLKTVVQMLAIALLLFDNHTYIIGNVFMIIAVMLTIISMFYYLEQVKKYF